MGDLHGTPAISLHERMNIPVPLCLGPLCSDLAQTREARAGFWTCLFHGWAFRPLEVTAQASAQFLLPVLTGPSSSGC